MSTAPYPVLTVHPKGNHEPLLFTQSLVLKRKLKDDLIKFMKTKKLT